MPFEYEALREQRQTTLVDFLIAELALGLSFMHSASLAYYAGHIPHCESAKRGAIKAADTVRRFLPAVIDGEIRADLDKQLAELYRSIETV